MVYKENNYLSLSDFILMWFVELIKYHYCEANGRDNELPCIHLAGVESLLFSESNLCGTFLLVHRFQMRRAIGCMAFP